MTVLVTGSTGFLGRHLVNALTKTHGYKSVVCLMHDAQMIFEDRPTIVRGDVRDLEFLRRTLSRYEIDTVYHLAAQTQVAIAHADPAATFEANVRGTWNVMEACRLERVKRVVVASSDKVYGDGKDIKEDAPLKPLCPYSASKAAADILAMAYITNYGMSVAVTRCGNLYGPGDTHWRRLIPGTIRSLLKGERPVFRTDGSGVRDWLYVGDAVEAYQSLLQSDQVGAFNISGGLPLSARYVVEMVCKEVGSDRDVEFSPPGETPELSVQTLNCSRARRAIAWYARRSMSHVLKETVAWYRKELLR